MNDADLLSKLAKLFTSPITIERQKEYTAAEFPVEGVSVDFRTEEGRTQIRFFTSRADGKYPEVFAVALARWARDLYPEAIEDYVGSVEFGGNTNSINSWYVEFNRHAFIAWPDEFVKYQLRQLGDAINEQEEGTE